jgi:hypothetical protein
LVTPSADAITMIEDTVVPRTVAQRFTNPLLSVITRANGALHAPVATRLVQGVLAIAIIFTTLACAVGLSPSLISARGGSASASAFGTYASGAKSYTAQYQHNPSPASVQSNPFAQDMLSQSSQSNNMPTHAAQTDLDPSLVAARGAEDTIPNRVFTEPSDTTPVADSQPFTHTTDAAASQHALINELITANSQFSDYAELMSMINTLHQDTPVADQIRNSAWYANWITAHPDAGEQKAMHNAINLIRFTQIKGQPVQCVGFTALLAAAYPTLHGEYIGDESFLHVKELLPDTFSTNPYQTKANLPYGGTAIKVSSIHDFMPGDLFLLPGYGGSGHIGMVLATENNALIVSDANVPLAGGRSSGKARIVKVTPENFNQVFGIDPNSKEPDQVFVIRSGQNFTRFDEYQLRRNPLYETPWWQKGVVEDFWGSKPLPPRWATEHKLQEIEIAWREQRTNKVIEWLLQAEGEGAWWKDSQGQLNEELIKAWILQREASILGDNPAVMNKMAQIINYRLRNGLDGKGGIEQLAAFTVVFNPSHRGDSLGRFDELDVAMWAQKPDEYLVKYIQNNTADDQTDITSLCWWTPQEVKGVNHYEEAIQGPSGTVFFGTQAQFNAAVGGGQSSNEQVPEVEGSVQGNTDR